MTNVVLADVAPTVSPPKPRAMAAPRRVVIPTIPNTRPRWVTGISRWISVFVATTPNEPVRNRPCCGTKFGRHAVS